MGEAPAGNDLHHEKNRRGTRFVRDCPHKRRLPSSRRTMEENRGTELTTANKEKGWKKGREKTTLVERSFRVVLTNDILPCQ